MKQQQFNGIQQLLALTLTSVDLTPDLMNYKIRRVTIFPELPLNIAQVPKIIHDNFSPRSLKLAMELIFQRVL